jgi:hypothetical protein
MQHFIGNYSVYELEYVDFKTEHHSACSETNLMHYLSSVYSVTIPLHILG